MITVEQLRQMMPNCPVAIATVKAPAISDAMTEFGIDQTPIRMAMYLANVAVETGEMRYAREIASGAAYEGRLDLGNTQPGDGLRFPGRGDLEVTGRGNYTACSLALFGDYRLLTEPELLEQPAFGSQAGGWFWQSRGLSLMADAGDFLGIRKKINGVNRSTGMPNGWDAAVDYFRRIKPVLGVA